MRMLGQEHGFERFAEQHPAVREVPFPLIQNTLLNQTEVPPFRLRAPKIAMGLHCEGEMTGTDNLLFNRSGERKVSVLPQQILFLTPSINPKENMTL